MAATAPRKLAVASDAALGFVSGPGDAVPWNVVAERLGELLRFLASALQVLVGELQDRAAALLASVVIAVFLFVCCCCCCAGVGRRRRGPDGEEVITAACDGPVVRYRRGGGWVFSMHPSKPIVC